MPKLYCDLDGVMADFDGHVADLFGKTPRELGDPTLWSLVVSTPSFWAGIPLKDDAFELWEAIRRYQPTFLTGCPRSDFARAASYKRRWVARHFGAEHPVITCLSKQKPDFMDAPGDVLIDDFIANTRRWEQAGGRAVLHRTAAKSISSVQRLLSNL